MEFILSQTHINFPPNFQMSKSDSISPNFLEINRIMTHNWIQFPTTSNFVFLPDLFHVISLECAILYLKTMIFRKSTEFYGKLIEIGGKWQALPIFQPFV